MDELDKARKKTDKILEQMEKNLRIIYKNRENEIRKEWDEYFEKMKPRLEKAWKKWKEAEKSGDEEEAIKCKEKYQKIVSKINNTDKEFKETVNKVTEKIAHVNEEALNYMNNRVPDIYETNSNGAAKHIQSSASKLNPNVGYRFDLVDSATVKKMLTEDIYAPLFRNLNWNKDKRWNRKLIHSQMSQAILLGESIDKIAGRIQNVTGANEKSAVRAARTMCTMSENTGRMDMFREAQKKGIVMQKEWLATTTDKRTRKAHLELNGQRAEVDDVFTNAIGDIAYPGDPNAAPANVYNCRCTLKSHIVGFRKKNGEIVKVEDFE